MAKELFRTKVLVRPNRLRCGDPNFVKGVFFGGDTFPTSARQFYKMPFIMTEAQVLNVNPT